MLLNLTEAPADPIERLMWLSGVREQADKELNDAYRLAYFEARLTGRIDQALGLHLHARKKVYAFTRAENEARGRVIKRWQDVA